MPERNDRTKPHLRKFLKVKDLGRARLVSQEEFWGESKINRSTERHREVLRQKALHKEEKRGLSRNDGEGG